VQPRLSCCLAAVFVSSRTDWCIQGNLSTLIHPLWVSVLDFGCYYVTSSEQAQPSVKSFMVEAKWISKGGKQAGGLGEGRDGPTPATILH